jgi:hypothetical protein
MEAQQRLDDRPFAVLVMSAINWPVVRPYVRAIVAAIEAARPGTVGAGFRPAARPFKLVLV